ncbi:MAG: methyltransferase domain-containing protein [Reichenbachiella sp.]|uniref:class I SAM-dependent methyltransferase n=1 Tax=Reichenbachiella sp. TaxID=2184521 RepID=UPI00326354F6
MTPEQLNKKLGNIDLYLLDQILKNRISKDIKILDAGCGEGRNLIYFLNNGYDVSGIDQNPDAIRMLHFIIGSGYSDYPKASFTEGEISQLPYPDHSFGYIICSAVLHFASSTSHFWQMFEALDRVLSPGGSLFVRMTSDIGLKGHVRHDKELWRLPDGSIRFLLTTEAIQRIIDEFGYSRIEPVKTVLVEGQRSMTTLVLKKK